MIMNARQHIYVKIMQFAAVLCQCVACHIAMEKRQVQRGGGRGNAQKEPRESSRESSEAEPHRLNLASQSKVDGLVTVVAAAAKGQLRERERETATQSEGEIEVAEENREKCFFFSNLQTKMCIKIYDEFKSKMGDGLRDRNG